MSTLESRITKLEQRPRSRVSEWRGHLARCFSDACYDGWREAIIEALCSERPQYSFRGELDGEPAYFVISWWDRDQAGEALGGRELQGGVQPDVRSGRGERAAALPEPTVMVMVRMCAESA